MASNSTTTLAWWSTSAKETKITFSKVRRALFYADGRRKAESCVLHSPRCILSRLSWKRIWSRREPDSPALGRFYGSNSMDRTLWRVRQAVDYIYLWSIVRTEAEYFLQLEDDVTLKSNFMSIIKNDIQKEKRDKNWFALGYSPQGLLCKLIRTRRMVPLILKARSIFHILPIDHIYWQLAWERNCLGGQTSDADCRKAREVFEKRKQNLVDHKGTMSSSGKFRKNR